MQKKYMKSKWDERYQEQNFYYGKDPNNFLKDVSGLLPLGANILCLAEGEGRNAVYLATLGHKVTALDQSAVGLNKLSQLAAQKAVNVETIVADLSDYKIEEKKWDAIVSIWCHIPSPLRTKVHADCVKGLKNSGLFILEAYTPEQLKFKTGGPENIDFLMTKDALINELKGLSFSIAREIEREIHEGQGHNGKSAVVQILARKE
jgi:2-polyprenyl-3-methyl-5-hydroxy-6-metoxy-1,4-benzoquinol methylase